MRSLVLTVCLFGLALPANAEEATTPATSTAEAITPLPAGRVEVRVEDLHCKTCAKKVSRKLYAVRGVKKVETSLKNDLVVIYVPKDKPVDATALWKAVEKGGQTPVDLRYLDQQITKEEMEPQLQAANPTSATK